MNNLKNPHTIHQPNQESPKHHQIQRKTKKKKTLDLLKPENQRPCRIERPGNINEPDDSQKMKNPHQNPKQ